MRRVVGVAVAVGLSVGGVLHPAEASQPFSSRALLRPLIQDVTGWADHTTTVALGAPMPDVAGDGIGPGSPLLIKMPGGTFICTANFVWTTGTTQYLGSAGHCFLPGGKTATHGPGADYNPASSSVRVCVTGCFTGGALTGLTGVWATLGNPAYARQNLAGVAVGNDFGLVAIPSTLSAQVRPSMPRWGGPSGVETNAGSKVTCHYGNGVFMGETLATKGRLGVGLGGNTSFFSAVHPAYGGDSGSAVNTCKADAGGFHGDKAVGILTHGTVDPLIGAVPLGQIRGTTINRAIQMATEASLSVALVTAS